MAKKRQKVWRTALIVVLGMAISGCSTKEESATYQRLRNKAALFEELQQLEKVIYREGTEEETILLVQYLPSKSGGEERFIVSGTPASRVDPATLALSRVEGSSPVKITPLAHDALPPAIRQSVPRWFRSYEVRYPASPKKKISWSLDLDGETKSLFFYKGPKYLIEKKSLLK